MPYADRPGSILAAGGFPVAGHDRASRSSDTGFIEKPESSGVIWKMKSSRETFSLTGALAASVMASACCIGPLALATLGLGGAAYAVALEPYRPWFIGFTTIFLGGAFYFIYRKPAPENCGPDGACETTSRRKIIRRVLWVVTLLTLAALTFPYYLEYIT
jgi:mercuric ion transport protein